MNIRQKMRVAEIRRHDTYNKGSTPFICQEKTAAQN